jgi:hypothetical protein
MKRLEQLRTLILIADVDLNVVLCCVALATAIVLSEWDRLTARANSNLGRILPLLFVTTVVGGLSWIVYRSFAEPRRLSRRLQPQMERATGDELTVSAALVSLVSAGDRQVRLDHGVIRLNGAGFSFESKTRTVRLTWGQVCGVAHCARLFGMQSDLYISTRDERMTFTVRYPYLLRCAIEKLKLGQRGTERGH